MFSFFFCPTDRPTFMRGRAMGDDTFYRDGLTKSEARKNLPGFQILMFCNGFLGFLSRKMTLSVGNQVARCTWESLLFSSWSFNFSFRLCLLAHYIQLKFTRSTNVFKFCQYAFIICNKLCVDISWPFHSQDFHMNSSVCHTFLNLLVLIIWC